MNAKTENKTATSNAPKGNARPQAQRESMLALDWNAESERMTAHAKTKGGSYGDQLGKVAEFVKKEEPASLLARSWAGPEGAAAFMGQNRNCLSKLPKLARKVTDGNAWTDAADLDPSQKRKRDASVSIVGTVFLSLPADSKGLSASEVAQKIAGRYDGGAQAQASAALDALMFAGIIERESAGGRGAKYSVRQPKVLRALVPEPVKV